MNSDFTTKARRREAHYLTAEIAEIQSLSSLCSLRLAPLVTPLSPLPHVELPDRPGSSGIIRLNPPLSGLFSSASRRASGIIRDNPG